MCALGAMVLLLFMVFGTARFHERLGFTYGKPAAVLRDRARELAIALSGGEAFAHEIHWYEYDDGIADLMFGDGQADESSSSESSLRPIPLVHHSRFGASDLTPSPRPRSL